MKCNWFNHDWDEWGKLLDCRNTIDLQQSRVCGECGKIQIRKISIGGQTKAEEFNDSMGI